MCVCVCAEISLLCDSLSFYFSSCTALHIQWWKIVKVFSNFSLMQRREHLSAAVACTFVCVVFDWLSLIDLLCVLSLIDLLCVLSLIDLVCCL